MDQGRVMVVLVDWTLVLDNNNFGSPFGIELSQGPFMQFF